MLGIPVPKYWKLGKIRKVALTLFTHDSKKTYPISLKIGKIIKVVLVHFIHVSINPGIPKSIEN